MLSIDVGTSGVRVALFDESGNQTHGVVRERVGDFAEVNPDQLVEEVKNTGDGLLMGFLSVASADTIAISTFWHSLMGVDANGKPTTSLLTWADTRAVREAQELRAEFDEAEIHARTGCRFHPSYWPAKLRWLKAEQPEKFNATQQWLGFAEYLCLRLFGEASASVSMASATGLFNQHTCDWDEELIRQIGVEY
jgi:gluconokinase